LTPLIILNRENPMDIPQRFLYEIIEEARAEKRDIGFAQ